MRSALAPVVKRMDPAEKWSNHFAVPVLQLIKAGVSLLKLN
jgi:hypothetical protein